MGSRRRLRGCHDTAGDRADLDGVRFQAGRCEARQRVESRATEKLTLRGRSAATHGGRSATPGRTRRQGWRRSFETIANLRPTPMLVHGMPLVELQRVEKHYRLGEALIPAVRGVDLTIEKGEF